MIKAWYGVDLDGTLAQHETGKMRGTAIGDPVPRMVKLVQKMLRQGKVVKIFTARVSPVNKSSDYPSAEEQRDAIQAWCLQHIGRKLDVVCCKDYAMMALYDDRAVAVEMNTGRILGGDLAEEE